MRSATADAIGIERTIEPLPPGVAVPASKGWVRELIVILVFKFVYDGIRALANSINVTPRAFANANLLVDLERSLGIYNELGLQRALLPADWFIRAMNIFYGTFHFVVPGALLIWMFFGKPNIYRRMRNVLGATTFLALIGYWAFPLAPPRMRGWEGFVDTLDSVGGLWSYHSAKGIANPFAAMPSLHFAWSVWCAIIVVRHIRRPSLRVLGVLYPTITLFAIVITANHYWLDAVGGLVVLAGGFGVVRLAERLHARRMVDAEDDETLSLAGRPSDS